MSDLKTITVTDHFDPDHPEAMPSIDRNAVGPCVICNRGLMHDNALTFYRIILSACVADLRSIQQQHGLEMMMGGNVGIARALSPTSTVARIATTATSWICLECLMRELDPALASMAAEMNR